MIETINFEELKWLHVIDPDERDYQYLSDTFAFHPLDIEDCRATNQRPKIDEYDDYYFLILHFPYLDKSNKFIRLKEVKVFGVRIISLPSVVRIGWLRICSSRCGRWCSIMPKVLRARRKGNR